MNQELAQRDAQIEMLQQQMAALMSKVGTKRKTEDAAAA
jgi:uncharacterized coiled-coil protein SlyX